MKHYSLWLAYESILSGIGERYVLRSKAQTELRGHTGTDRARKGPQWTKRGIEPDYVGARHGSDVGIGRVNTSHPYGRTSRSR